MSQKFLRTTAVLLGLAAALPVSAADISWSTGPTFNGPNGHLGILTNGSLVEAINLVQCLSNAHTFRLWPVTASWRYGHAEFFAKFLHLWHSKHNVLDFDCGQPNR